MIWKDDKGIQYEVMCLKMNSYDIEYEHFDFFRYWQDGTQIGLVEVCSIFHFEMFSPENHSTVNEKKGLNALILFSFLFCRGISCKDLI